VEVCVAEERDHRPPCLAGVGRLDQPEQRRQLLLARVGVTRAEEAVRADDREALRVLVAIRDPDRLPRVLADPEESGVGRDEE